MVLKLSIAGAVVTALLMAFLVVRTSDEVAPAGTKTVVSIWQSGDTFSRSEARQVVAETARQHDLTLYKSVNTVTDDRTLRTLYVINQGKDHELAPPSESYRDFGRFLHTGYLPCRDLKDAELGGMYVTSVSEGDADAFAQALNERGMSVTTHSFGPVGMLLWTSSLVPLVPLLAAALLALMLGCVQSTIAYRRRDAVLLVNGGARSRTILNHLGTGLLLTGVLGAGGLVLSAPVLALYNGLAQFGRFALAAGVGFGAVASVVTAIILLVSLAESGVKSLSALNGKRPLRRLAAANGAIHLGLLAVVLVITGSVVLSGRDAAGNRDDSSSWRAAERFVSMNFHTSEPEFTSLQGKFAQIAWEGAGRGAALIASHPGGALGPGNGPEDGNSLVVNTPFLVEQPVDDAAGRRVVPGALNPHALTLLVPYDLRDNREQLIDQYRDWTRFQTSVDGEEPTANETPIDLVVTESGQRIFNYSTFDPTSSQVNPVIAVLPSTTPLVSNEWIASAMTGAEVLFGNAPELRAELRAANLEQYIGSIDRVSDIAAVRLSDQERVLRASTFAGILAALITVLSSAVLAVSITERNRRIDFTRYVNGAAPLRATLVRTAVLALSGGLALAAASFVQPFSDATGFGVACLVVVADLAVVGVLLALQSRRIRADTVKRS